mmetsp:Transcript_12104/g.16796  ORF Transcript_12104/g.16796 Transcript_12104/m.16796 type:complete len:100 (+) Transcript_12104:249-548(+)
MCIPSWGKDLRATFEERMPKFFFGHVIKKSSTKTVKVLVNQYVFNARAQRRLKVKTKLLTHDPEEKCNIGDFVKVRHTGENVSKRKAHIVDRIIRAQEQ